MRGNIDEARDLYRRAAAMLADLGPSVTSSTLSTESSRVEALAGYFAAAERELRRDDLALAAMGERYYRSTVDALLAQVLVTLGNLDEAEAFSRKAEELADADDVSSQVFWRTARGRILARSGGATEGEALAREAVEMARGTVDIALLAGALADLAGRSSPSPSARTRQGPPSGRPSLCTSARKTRRPRRGWAAPRRTGDRLTSRCDGVRRG